MEVKKVDIKDIKDLIITINNTDIERVEIEKDNTRIMISKGTSNKRNEQIVKTSNHIEVEEEMEVIQGEEGFVEDENIIIVKSPMVGVFYQSPSPGEEPFVKVASRVAFPEPLGGAHKDKSRTANNIRNYISKELRCLIELEKEELIHKRYEKFRSIY